VQIIVTYSGLTCKVYLKFKCMDNWNCLGTFSSRSHSLPIKNKKGKYF